MLPGRERMAATARLHTERHLVLLTRANADTSVPGGMTVIYRDLIASEARTGQVITDVTQRFSKAGGKRLVLTSWIEQLRR